MTPLALALNSALLHLVWQGVVVAFLLWMTLAVLRRRSAGARYIASCAALGLLTLLPVVTACLAYQRPLVVPLRAGTGIVTAMFVSRIPAPTNWLALAQAWMLPVWACGVALLSMRLLWGFTKVSTLKRAGNPAEPDLLAMVSRLSERIGVARPVRVLISSLPNTSGVGPCVIGWLRPVVLLPTATLLGLAPEQLEAVLAHELAHIRRYDYLVNLLQMLVETLFFYHPAVWWISGRIRQERELCCDDIAVRSCGDAVGYARALTALERMRVLTPSLALGVQDGPLMYRIQRLLGATPREHGPSRLPGIVAILLAVTCFSTDVNPVKAQAPLPLPAPPSGPSLSPAPSRRAIPTLMQLTQANQPAPAENSSAIPSIKIEHSIDAKDKLVFFYAQNNTQSQSPPPSAGGAVTVEVTIDQNGEVSDARIVTGPAEQRRSALIRALSMRFPLEDAATHRWVDIPAPPPAPSSGQALLRPVPSRATVAEIQGLKGRIDVLRAQQAGASTADQAQIQNSIDASTRSLQQMELIAAGQDPLVGTTLEEIEISYLTDAERDQLIAKLPIRMHDVLTDNSMRAAVRVAHAAHPNATIYFGQTEGGQAGLVIIGPPPHIGREQLQYLAQPAVR
jgi:beta-lactamase regulating signal transducer with metallopeptidase domain